MMRLLGCVLALICILALVNAGGYAKDQEKPRVERKQGLTYTGASAVPSPVRNIEDLPASFDWGDVNGRSYLSPNQNQHLMQYCGSCWIHGTLSSLNDRIKIARGGNGPDVMLARQVLLNCGKAHGLGNGCGGGDSYDALEYMHRYGLPDETCQVYQAKPLETCDDFAVCHNCMPVDGEFKCWPVTEFTKYYVTEYGRVSGEAAMMSEIFSRGPIACGFATTDHFDYKYKGGVYVDKTNQTKDDINHDVEVVGWGVTEDGVKYWRARNSWGSYWGENGFFKIIRGVNNMAFETDCAFGIVDVRDSIRMDWGEVVGGMHGLRPKPYKRQVESGDYIVNGEANDDGDDDDEDIQEQKKEQAEKQQKATEKKAEPSSGNKHRLGDKLSLSKKDNDPVTGASSSVAATAPSAEAKQQFISDQLQQVHLEQQEQQERLKRSEQERQAKEYQAPAASAASTPAPSSPVTPSTPSSPAASTPSTSPSSEEQQNNSNEDVDSFDEDEQDEQYAQHHPHFTAAQTQNKGSNLGLWLLGGGVVLGAAAFMYYRRERHSYEPISTV